MSTFERAVRINWCDLAPRKHVPEYVLRPATSRLSSKPIQINGCALRRR